MFYVTKAVVPYMKEQHSGVILNTSSMVSIYGQPSGVGYPASKFAVNGLTKSLARELAPSNIRVNSIAPGIIDTDMNKYLSQKELQEIKEEIPLGKIGDTLAIAKCAKWLIEDNYTTGQVISPNGGWVI